MNIAKSHWVRSIGIWKAEWSLGTIEKFPDITKILEWIESMAREEQPDIHKKYLKEIINQVKESVIYFIKNGLTTKEERLEEKK